MEKVADTHHLICRKGVWYYCRRVPEHLVAAVGKPVIKFSLQTKNKKEAIKLREAWDLRWSAQFDDAESVPAAAPTGKLAAGSPQLSPPHLRSCFF
jgi:hypothetical protein